MRSRSAPIADDAQLHHASTGASICGQKSRSASVSVQSNFRFRCYRSPGELVDEPLLSRDPLVTLPDVAQSHFHGAFGPLISSKLELKGDEILACQNAGMTPFVPKPLTSASKAEGRFGKQDFVYLAEDNTYRCPAGERLTWRFASVEDGMTLHSYWTSACQTCPLKAKCTTGKERRIKRWEHEGVLEIMQQRLDQAPEKMEVRRQTVEQRACTRSKWSGGSHVLNASHSMIETFPSFASSTNARAAANCRESRSMPMTVP